MTEQKSINGIKVKRKKLISHWRTILNEWTQIHEDFASRATDDVGYWYTERTNVGFLSIATWRAGFIALEEHQKDKKDPLDNRKKANGRGDFWIKGDSFSESVEAKQKYIQLGHPSNQKTIDAHLDYAVREARRARSKWDDLHTGILFAPAYLPVDKAENHDDIDSQIKKSLSVLDNINADFYAWSFPEDSRYLTNAKEQNYFPGIILIGRRGQ